MFKFLRQKPFEIEIEHDMWDAETCVYTIPASVHKKGRNPRVQVCGRGYLSSRVVDNEGTVEVFRGLTPIWRGVPFGAKVSIYK